MPYVGKEPVRGQNRELDDISGSFNGGNTAFTMQVGGLNTAAASANQVFINLGGVMQNPGTDFTVASSTITFTTPPANGLDFWGLIQGDAVDIQEPADGSVTSSKIASGNLTLPGDVTIPDKIVHDGDTNTAIRFPAADTVSIETGGSERARVDSSGRLLVGHNASVGDDRQLQVIGDSADTSAIATARFSADANGPKLDLIKSRNATKGSNTIVQDNDVCGEINFLGCDGTDLLSPVAQILGIVNGTPGANDMPGALTFRTTSDGGVALSERMRIDKTGDVTITDGDLVIGTSGHGIDFSATGGPSNGSGDSELFADYEEGQFTPTIGGWTTPGTPTYHGSTGRRGYYQKVGNMVTCWMYLAWEGLSSPAGVLFIGGLPFGVKNTTSFSAPNGNIAMVSGTTMSSQITMPDLTSGGDVTLHQYGGMGASALMYQSRHEENYNAVIANSGRNDSSSYTKEFFCSLYYPTS